MEKGRLVCFDVVNLSIRKFYEVCSVVWKLWTVLLVLAITEWEDKLDLMVYYANCNQVCGWLSC